MKPDRKKEVFFSRRLSPWLVVASLAFSSPALANGPAPLVPVPLAPMSSARLREMGPLLHDADVAVIESDDRGWQKQITTMTLAAASPQAVREVLIHPEHYGEFVHNMRHSTIEKGPDGTIDHHWEVSYAVVSADGVNRYRLLPPDPEVKDAPAPVEITDPTGCSHYRWEFLPAGSGGGTIVVVYGYTDMRHSGGFLGKAVAQAGSLEYGLALVTQMSMLLSMKNRAEQQPGDFAPYVRLATGTRKLGYGFLLERGTVALLRKQGGHLAGVSLIDRSKARPEALLDAAARAAQWAEYVPSISRSAAAGEQNGFPTAEVVQTLPLMSWKTIFGVRAAQGAVDMVGLSGDLLGAQLRWDVRSAGGGAGQKAVTELVLRASQHFDKSSLLMRQLYKLEPLFEYGVNVGLDYVILKGVKSRAERQTASL